MNGMIFAAGLGTRLQPLTNDRPKALVEVAGKPLLEYVIRKMIAADVQRIVVNVHHYADQIEAFLCERHFFDWDIVISDEREKLLDTGGGLLKARELFSPGESVLIHNVDIFSDIDIPALLRFHRQNKGDATLVTRTGGKGRGLRFNREGMLKGWENKATGFPELCFLWSAGGEPGIFRTYVRKRGLFDYRRISVTGQASPDTDVFLRRTFFRFRDSSGDCRSRNNVDRFVQPVRIFFR